MLYALTRADGGVTVTHTMPKEITKDGKTMPVTRVDSANKTLHALDDDKALTFPLPSDDMRTYEVDSVPGAVLTFHDIQSAIANSPEPIVSCEKITIDQIPPERTFRNAWTANGKSITVDMAKARDIQKDKMREARKPLLAALDIAYQRADEVGDTDAKKQIAAQKQALRDVTADPAIAAATTPEQLAAVWPAVLG